MLLISASRLDELKDAGCQLTEPKELFIALMGATSADPCTTGCAYFDGGRCPAYRKYHTDYSSEKAVNSVLRPNANDGLIGGRWTGMTIRQIAKEEGISLSKVRENKQLGKYKS